MSTLASTSHLLDTRRLRSAGLFAIGAVFALAAIAGGPRAVGQDAAGIPGSDRVIRLGEGRLVLEAPPSWKAVRPQTRIVEYEFQVLDPKDETVKARVTIMGAGGGVEANIARWVDQFEQPDGSSTKDKTKVETSEKAGARIYIVSITGTYKDRPGGGPFTNTPIVPRPGYRMLSAIIVTPKFGHYYIKMVGPEKTVTAHEEAFRQMVQSLKIQPS
ncbi:MAG: hypothetical protein KatS3mg110_1219 [Pirellulaceae bacterium]|nr:MAG: hypothetical protein KatS3mg110_1219 [Pirellulaceae bacterium]